MKRILISTAAILGTAAPALADADMLRDRLETKLGDIAPEVDVSALSADQVTALYADLASEDSAAEQRRSVDAIVADSQYRMDPETTDMTALGGRNDIRAVVADMMSEEPVDVDVDTLSDEQVAALYLELTGGDDSDATAIEAIVQ
ncbi:MAG: hypothetical protein GVX90_03405 [Alphaproteobacteria bacterium]|jgi:tetrahydromethanopterin S-methyltransferase subunit B|nr:hypothetical protein [Alphaproteobacteria bacterium]